MDFKRLIHSCILSATLLSSVAGAADWANQSKPLQVGSDPSGIEIRSFEYQRPGSLGDSHASVQFDFTSASQPWQISSLIAQDEQRLQLGVQSGQNQLSLISGQGDGYSQVEHAFAGTDPYYFHGGSRLEFQYHGASMLHQFSDSVTTAAGLVRIQSDGVEDRSTWFSGLQVGAGQAVLLRSYRGNEVAGHGLDLNLGWADFDASLQMLESTAGARATQWQLGFTPTAVDRFELRWQRNQNPLIDDVDGSRLMFNYERSLGASYGLYATDQTEEDAKKAGVNRTVAIGAAALGAALVLSSGSSSQDSSDRNAEQHTAARNVLNKYNPRSVRENREYGGLIYRTPDGRYAATSVTTGDIDSVQIPFSLIPAGNTATASFHTHGGPDPRYANEVFSPQDITVDQYYEIDGYLGTPAGRMLWHDYSGRKVSELGKIAN